MYKDGGSDALLGSKLQLHSAGTFLSFSTRQSFYSITRYSLFSLTSFIRFFLSVCVSTPAS